MGSRDLFLTWGEGNALTEVSGELAIADLAASNSRTVYVSHSATPLALWSAPVFSLTAGDVDDLTLTIIARGADDTDTYRATDGEGFLVKVDVAAGASQDDWDIHWTRRGVAE